MDITRAEIEILIGDLNKTIEALKDMVNQFAYETKKENGIQMLSTGGLSTLENAFEVLGLKDPCKRSDLE